MPRISEDSLRVKPWGDGRFAIYNLDGSLADDCQGYGYTTPAKARKAMWWRFKGGKQKVRNEEGNARSWIKSNNLIEEELVKEVNGLFDLNFKDVYYGHCTNDDLWKCLEEQFNVKFPQNVRKYLLN